MVEEEESLRGPCLEKPLLALLSQQVSAGSRVEVTDRQGSALASLVEPARWDGIDRA